MRRNWRLQDQVPHYLRCQNRPFFSFLLKGKKRVSNIKHFQMLKLMFYLKITKLMLSLLLLLFVCLLHNEKPSFLPLWNPCFLLLKNMLFVDTMSVPHASWQTNNTVVWTTVYQKYLGLCFSIISFYSTFYISLKRCLFFEVVAPFERSLWIHCNAIYSRGVRYTTLIGQ